MDDLHDELLRLIDDPQAFVHSPRPELRRLAASLLDGSEVLSLLADDPEASVRAAAAEALATSSEVEALIRGGGDGAPEVREAIAFALGEIGDRAAVRWLMEVASADPDDGVRETAVASLGAIEDPTALPLLVELSSSASPKVRRRAVVALSAFDEPRADEAIRAAASDRNPMVREAAEMVVGPAPVDLPFPTRAASPDENSGRAISH